MNIASTFHISAHYTFILYDTLKKSILFLKIIVNSPNNFFFQCKKLKAVSAAILLLLSTVDGGTAASYGDTQQAFEDCKLFLEHSQDRTSEELRRANACSNFVIGAWDMGEYLAWRDIFIGKSPSFCPPEEEVEVTQPILVFVNYVEEHPEKMKNRLAMVLEWSFNRAYPCTDAYFIKLVK
ncbi:MAG: Rap1a/Tai family immunity protein [Desulfofustis sp.]|jgi:hypothetical protein